MRIGQAAALAGLNVETLRYYERRGLLPTPPRRPSGYRVYSPESVQRVRFVRRAERLGFDLAEVEVMLDLAAGGPDEPEAARQVAREKLVQLDRKIASLRAMRAALQRLHETCSLPRERRRCPLLSPQ